MTDAESTAGSDTDTADVATHLESALSKTLEARDALAVVHVGTDRDPAVRYCRPQSAVEEGLAAIAFDGEAWLVETATDAAGHPAETLATALFERVGSGTILTPARLPHDAALYLEQAGFELASTDVIERTRATKTAGERERIEATQTAAAAGIRHAASLLADATVDEGRLVVDGKALTPGRLRTVIDEAIVSAGAFPAGNTVVNPDPDHRPSSRDAAAEALRPGEPIVLETAPRGPAGYHGGLVRTFVVDGDGGRERRAHVGVTQSFRSAAAMLTADTESVVAVEADLEAEVRAFGFEDADTVQTRVTGVGLEPRERPRSGDDEIEPGHVVRLESAVHVDGGQWLRIADILVRKTADDRATYLPACSRSLDPAAVLEE
ncbi:M24 family metallopeptidase [Natronorubrum thiooxidans]|uniref:Xaa-Pro aminopeptidase n=1 Tax=Natronorubrum thiooxidans TaxID=308853 RepID=A0A1N7CUN8_9EURY|nr:M24 family metallopeptidase [Natronorubrum thiooxidans]SIR67260.1 Xaa-Pro aminopeptidase [Natronorubrum thiooxidans]